MREMTGRDWRWAIIGSAVGLCGPRVGSCDGGSWHFYGPVRIAAEVVLYLVVYHVLLALGERLNERDGAAKTSRSDELQ